jgi:hypothetical protein
VEGERLVDAEGSASARTLLQTHGIKLLIMFIREHCTEERRLDRCALNVGDIYNETD